MAKKYSATFSRRNFMTYAGLGALATLGNPFLGGCNNRTAPRRGAAPTGEAELAFEPVEPSVKDELIVPSGYKFDVVGAWGDDLGSSGPHGKESFGFDCDFNAFFPIDALSGGSNPHEGLLFTNNEYPVPLFVSGYTGEGKKSEEQIVAEKLSVGASLIHVRQTNGRWERVAGKQTRRFTALYPTIEMSGPAAGRVPHGVGTLANCSGGRTPWHTALSCEENFQDYNKKHRWDNVAHHKIDESHYGWVVEIDPFGELEPLKLSSLGRFAHENVAWRLSSDNRIVCYMGDDAQNQCLYKFVSRAPYRPGASRADNRKLLSEGVLYAADFGKGRWLPLDIQRSPELRAAGFKSQAEVLLRCRDAAGVLGATPLDRPEDCEVHPLDGTLYVALTNNTKHGNFYGQIVRLIEDGDDAASDIFRFEIFLVGGPQSGLACPDNLTFDAKGNLWVGTDISTKSLNDGAYESFHNNGMFFVPTRGAHAGEAFQFASAPVEAELTGPWFSPDEKTLFISVQHPGEESESLSNLTSHWPNGGTPRPSVIAITGF